ncbi:hypothetical protein [Leclercia sp.]|uniref:hypothetical protein n=1 Tax=Leclercia sp. TaxID=1898428 RepID=UPI0028AD6C23|nr:hypothetical protein [Leclercia sp.]
MIDINELSEIAKSANKAGHGSPEMAEFRVTATPDAVIELALKVSTLEARVKGLEAKHTVEMNGADARNKLLFDAKNHWAARARAAEAELERLKAQPHAAYIIQDKKDREGGRVGHLSFRSHNAYSEEDVNEYEISSTPLYAEPLPAVLQPEKVTQRSDWTVGDWVQHVGGRYQGDNPSNYVEFGSMQAVGALLKQVAHSASINGYNQAIADARALGCQPQRFVVKLPTLRLWAGKIATFTKGDVIAAIKAAGGEIAE